MFRYWKRAIETYPKRDATLFPVRFYDLLAVSDFHAAAGNHPSPEGIVRLTATEGFYFDDAVFRFLYHCERERRQRGGYRYELVFNGDMLDFAQVVVPLGQRPPLTPWPLPPFLEFSPQDPTGRQGLSAGGRSLPSRLFQTLARVHGIVPLAKATYEQRKVLRAAGKSTAALSLDGFLKGMLRAALEEEARCAALEEALRAALNERALPAALEEALRAALEQALHAVSKEEALRAALEKALFDGLKEALRAEVEEGALRAEVEEKALHAAMEEVSSIALKRVLDDASLVHVRRWLYDEQADEVWDDWADDEGWEADEWAERGTWDSGEWSDEDWETHVTHRTRCLEINMILPKSRPPRRATLVESNRQRSHHLGKSAQVPLPDGRWLVTWKTQRPRLYENYILQWQW